jgi:hypothetical protein
VELDECLLPLSIDELEGVNAVSLHVTPVSRDARIIQQPRQLMRSAHNAEQSAAAHK